MLSEGPASRSGRQSDPKLESACPARFAEPAAVPDAASGSHPFDTAGGQQARRSVRVFITNASLCDIGNGGDAGMRVEPEAGERRTLIIDEVKEHERFQKPSKVGW